MKKLLLLAVVAGFAATLIGCGPGATTSKTTTAGPGGTESKDKTEKKN
jgi:hypothetical protein